MLSGTAHLAVSLVTDLQVLKLNEYDGL